MLCNVTNYDIKQVQPPFHTVGNNCLSVIEGSSITRRRQVLMQTSRTVSSDQVQMDALILTVELAYCEILSIEHTEGLDCQRRKCQTIRNDHYDGVECITRG